MIAGIDLENTPDFEYLFEDAVNLPEFDLYHIGLGFYRFGQPQFYGEDDFNRLKEKYPSLRFYYMTQTNAHVKLLLVMSGKYNATKIFHINGKFFKEKLTKILPKGYDADLDQIIIGDLERIGNIETSGYYGAYMGSTNRLLGFRWELDQYADLCGNRIYIMFQGHVAKRIAVGMYAFQGITTFAEHDRTYPYIFDTIYSQKCERCAVVGKCFSDWGERTVIFVRYIAFDDIGIRSLRKLYKYTVGYEYREVTVKTEMDARDYERRMVGSVLDEKAERAAEERELEEKINTYCSDLIGENTAELVEGIGYRDLLLWCRLLPGGLLPDTEDKTEGWLQYDVAYFESGFEAGVEGSTLKLIDIDEKNVIECNIPTETIAELEVVVKTEICMGVEDNILVKVIDHTDTGKAIVEADHCEQFVEDVD